MGRRIVIGAGLLAGASAFAARLLRRRSHEANGSSPSQVAADEPVDVPGAGETRFDEEVDAEAEQRHDAVERLKADPFSKRL